MPGIDTSMYGALSPQNPVPQLNSLVGLQQGMLQNAAQAQTLRARMAMGPIMQQSVDPQTGQVDYAKAALSMAQNSDTAYLAPDFMTAAVQRQGNQLDNQLKQWNVVQQEQTQFAKHAAALAPMGDAVTRADVGKQMGELWSDATAAGIATPDLMQRLLTFQGSLAPDGPALAQQLKQAQLTAGDTSQTLGATMGQFQSFDTGNGTMLAWTHPITGEVKPVGIIGKNPSVADMNALVTRVNPNGSTDQVPRWQAGPMYSASGNTHIAPPAAPPAPGVSGPASAPPAVPASPTAPAGGKAPQALSGGIPTTLAPATEKFLEGQGSTAVAYQKQINDDATNSQTQMQYLQQLEELSKKVQTGGFGAAKEEVGRVLQGLGAPKSVYDSVADGNLGLAQAFAKYAIPQAVANLRQAAGTGQRFALQEYLAFQKANPNLDTDPRAIQKVYELNNRIYSLSLLKQQAFQKWISTPRGDGTSRNPMDFEGNWTNSLVKKGYLAPQLSQEKK